MTDENLAEVEQLCESQDDKQGPHNSQCQAARIINGMSRRLMTRAVDSTRVMILRKNQTDAKLQFFHTYSSNIFKNSSSKFQNC